MEPEKRPGHREVSKSPPPSARQISQEDRQRVVRAAFLKPLNLTMLFIGGGFFLVTQTWWMIPLTLVTYALLVILASRDSIFINKVLNKDTQLEENPDGISNLPPERRARWLPRGETRHAVEEALVTYRKLVASIEDSSEVARQVLDDTIPRLHAAAERLVEVAQEREKAAEAVREIQSYENDAPDEERLSILRGLESKIKTADEEVSGTRERLLTLRARMVGVSLNSDVENRAAALEMNRSLDELNYRLEALGELSDSSHDAAAKDNDA